MTDGTQVKTYSGIDIVLTKVLIKSFYDANKLPMKSGCVWPAHFNSSLITVDLIKGNSFFEHR